MGGACPWTRELCAFQRLDLPVPSASGWPLAGVTGLSLLVTPFLLQLSERYLLLEDDSKVRHQQSRLKSINRPAAHLKVQRLFNYSLLGLDLALRGGTQHAIWGVPRGASR